MTCCGLAWSEERKRCGRCRKSFEALPAPAAPNPEPIHRPFKIHETLRLWREARGWTQLELAQKMGTARSLVCRYERAKGENCTVGYQYLRRIMPILRIQAVTALGDPLLAIAALPDLHRHRLLRIIKEMAAQNFTVVSKVDRSDVQ